jgi:1-acylglycerone phosphate reductase
VVTVVAGAVATSFKANIPEPNLPKNSLYLPVKDTIESISRGEQVKNPMPSDAFAEEVVKDVLGGKTGQIWRGSGAGLGRIAKMLFPGWLLVSLPHVFVVYACMKRLTLW